MATWFTQGEKTNNVLVTPCHEQKDVLAHFGDLGRFIHQLRLTPDEAICLGEQLAAVGRQLKP